MKFDLYIFTGDSIVDDLFPEHIHCQHTVQTAGGILFEQFRSKYSGKFTNQTRTQIFSPFSGDPDSIAEIERYIVGSAHICSQGEAEDACCRLYTVNTDVY